MKKTNDNLDEKYLKNQRENRILLVSILILLLFLFIIYLTGSSVAKLGYGVKLFSGLNTTTIKITENGKNWRTNENLDIFNNPIYNNKKLIAPGSRNSYTFEIKNLLTESTIYNIYFKETNDYNINMKYRLKLDNVYVVGGPTKWVNAKELDLENIVASQISTNTYTLDWYWQDNTNDTEIGKKVYADYKLEIKVLP